MMGQVQILDFILMSIYLSIRLYKLERVFLQQVDLKSALDSNDFLLNNF